MYNDDINDSIKWRTMAPNMRYGLNADIVEKNRNHEMLDFGDSNFHQTYELLHKVFLSPQNLAYEKKQKQISI